MTLDIDAYVAELKEELKAVKAENKSLNEQLQAKEKELLQKQFNESAEVKKISEELAPFKKLKVSAKTLNETVRRSQELVKKTKAEKAAISEELEIYKKTCGSIDSVNEAVKLSARALSTIHEYQEIGSVEELKKLKENSVKALATVAEAKKLGETYTRVINHLKSARKLKESATKALKLLNDYKKVVGSLEEARKLSSPITESKTNKLSKKISVSEALDLAKKYNCTVESAAKLIRKYGTEKATGLMESLLSNKTSKNKLEKSTKLVEEVAQLDKVTNVPAEKSAKDFLTTGMIRNYFNHDSLGKEIPAVDINSIDGTKAPRNAAKEILKKYSKAFEVEKAPSGLDKEFSPAQAEAAAKKLLK
jgi:hypothetical protein